MIFLQLKIDNFYMFKGTFIDFTYPKKIKNSTIEGEYLTEFPNIKYKKVCIFMGANASGKTSLGRVMCMVNNYLNGESLNGVAKKICNKDKNALFDVVYIMPETKQIHRLIVEFNQDGLTFEKYQACKLKKTHSLEKTLEDVNTVEPVFTYDKNNNKGVENPGFRSAAHMFGYELEETSSWNYCFSEFNNSTTQSTNLKIDLLKKILQSFDSSITGVEEITALGTGSYVVKFVNGDKVVVDNGKIITHERFSRGTLESIEVAGFINFLQTSNKGVFFLDEKMAYSHSEIEISMLNLMINSLKENSQLFYTSHNHDVLEMNLPTHSYVFMQKNEFVEISHPEKMGFTKNDRSLLSYVKNDVFSTMPDTSKIEELL